MLVVRGNIFFDLGHPRLTEMVRFDPMKSQSHGHTVRNLSRATKDKRKQATEIKETEISYFAICDPKVDIHLRRALVLVEPSAPAMVMNIRCTFHFNDFPSCLVGEVKPDDS